MAGLSWDSKMQNDETVTAEEIQAAFQEKSRWRIAAAIGTLRQTLQEEHEQHVDYLLRDAPSDAIGTS